MDFRKKLKTRLYTAIIMIATGITFIVISAFVSTENEFLSSFGFAWIVIGIVRIRNYFLITKNEETIRKQEIAETDERNIAIANKAKSVAFMVYIFAVCIAVIVLSILNIYRELEKMLCGSVCLLVLIYWVSYHIISRKN